MGLSRKQAIDKIAREMGRVQGLKSLPKIFPDLKETEYGYKITKTNHITEVLTKCKSTSQRFTTLQKIFSLHPDLSKTIIGEIEPALKTLGFNYQDGVIIESKKRLDKSLKTKATRITSRYSRISSLISKALVNKGEKLSEAYFTVYLIENHLRLFIWKTVGKSNTKLSRLLTTGDRRKINDRKQQEKINKWLSLRKKSDLFYLDIDDLGKLIQRNVTVFSPFFSDLNALRTKIDEISLIRNRVAHNNSSITETEKKALELYMDQLFMQIK